MKRINSTVIFIAFFLFQGTVLANGNVSFIVSKALLAYDTAKTLSKAAHIVTKADTVLKMVDGRLKLEGALGEAIKLGAGANFIFVAPLTDGRYFIQALAENDVDNIAYYGTKIALYYYNPLCYQAVGYLEAGNRVLELYQTAIQKNREWRQHYLDLAKKGRCNLL